MIRRTLIVLLALAPSLAWAQIIVKSGGGSGTVTLTAGTTATSGCTDGAFLYSLSNLIQCGALVTTNGSTSFGVGTVTTASRAKSTFLDTISGSSTTSNFLNITGTVPASLSAVTNGVFIDITGVNSASEQNGLYISGPANASGSGSSFGIQTVMKTGNGNAQVAIKGFSAGVGDTTGVNGTSVGSGIPKGVVGIANCSTGCTQGIGVVGTAYNGTANLGGWFGLSSSPPVSGVTAALVADNASIAADIFVAKDNGTVVFTIADNGYVQGTMGEVALNANYTNATASFTSTTLSVAVVSGRTYSFDLNLMFSDSTAVDGAQFDFNGGSAAATNFDVHCTAANNVGTALGITNAASTALVTAVQVALALTSQTGLICRGSFVPSGSGTFIVRGAQTAHTAGTLTINRGSWLNVRDARPL